MHSYLKHFDTYNKRGAALLLFLVFFMLASFTMVMSLGNGAYDDLVSYRTLSDGMSAYYGTDAGVEDAIYRYRNAMVYTGHEAFQFASTTVDVIRTLSGGEYQFIVVGDNYGTVRTNTLSLATGSGVSFNFGMQAGNGGIRMFNSSSVQGNVFSNGTVEGSGNFVYGDVISAGPTGEVELIHATGSVWAHSIENSTIEGDAYYQSITGSSVNPGTQYLGSPDQATATMPISDEDIDAWKTLIQTTGIIIASTSPQCLSGTYTINTNTTLNNVKIECNVVMKKQGASTVITLAGPVWVEGDLDFNSGPTMVASSSLGSNSTLIIVDKESDRLTSSKVRVNAATTFSSGNANSYTMIISRNNSAELGGTEKAIDLGQTTLGKVVVYAPHGLIELGQSTSLKEVTAYQIKTSNSAQVIYESGLASLLFTSGPGGGYTVTSWSETE